MKASDKQVGGTHYKDAGVQPWDVVDTWPLEQRIGYYRGGALKYVMRMGSKDESIQEIGKGIHYLEKLLEILKEQNYALHEGRQEGLQTAERTGGQQTGSPSAPGAECQAEPGAGESGHWSQGRWYGRVPQAGLQQGGIALAGQHQIGSSIEQPFLRSYEDWRDEVRNVQAGN